MPSMTWKAGPMFEPELEIPEGGYADVFFTILDTGFILNDQIRVITGNRKGICISNRVYQQSGQVFKLIPREIEIDGGRR